MNPLFIKIGFIAFILFFVGCTSSPTRESDPNKFDLLQTGQINKENILIFKTCLIEYSEVKKRIAYNVKTKQSAQTNGYKVESYGGNVLLLLSIDIFNSGKIQMFRVKNSELTDLSQQIRAFDICLTKYK